MSDNTGPRLRWRKRMQMINRKRRHKPLVLMLAQRWRRRL